MCCVVCMYWCLFLIYLFFLLPTNLNYVHILFSKGSCWGILSLNYDWLYIHTNGSQHLCHLTQQDHRDSETRRTVPAETRLILMPWFGHTLKKNSFDLNSSFFAKADPLGSPEILVKREPSKDSFPRELPPSSWLLACHWQGESEGVEVTCPPSPQWLTPSSVLQGMYAGFPLFGWSVKLLQWFLFHVSLSCHLD